MAGEATRIYFLLLLISLSSCQDEDINHTDEDRSCAAGEDCSTNAVQITPMSDEKVEEPSQDSHTLNNVPTKTNHMCPSGIECHMLPIECISCAFNLSCVYGLPVNVSCSANTGVVCQGPKSFERTMVCQFCYQTSPSEHYCKTGGHCSSSQRYVANCTTNANILCLGNRTFLKNIRCNWTSGYRWITALLLSITLGGFGADRFYLGHWQEGIGKLFSFGGLGVWTIVDVVLVAVGYLRPADGSLYI